jgi:hypothetical protein
MNPFPKGVAVALPLFTQSETHEGDQIKKGNSKVLFHININESFLTFKNKNPILFLLLPSLSFLALRHNRREGR